MFAIIASVLIGSAQSLTFEATSLSSSGLSFSIDIGETTTSVTVTAPRNKWSGIGFGAQAMQGTVATIFAGTTSGITQRRLGDHAKGAPLEVYWTIDSITENTTDSLTYIMSRNNDISETCGDCYVFDSSASSLQVIYALGSGTTFEYHGSTRRPETLTTGAPTPSPVQATTLDPEDVTYDECVGSDDTQLIGQISLSMSRNTEIDHMQIVMSGPDSAWFAYGFGSTSMAGTYAIVSVDSSVNGTEEYILATHNISSMILSADNSWISEPTVSVADGVRTVTLIRPYSTDETYDFTAFMSATDNSLGIISALGMDTNWPMKHMEKASKTITTSCSVDGSTPSPVVAPGPGDGSNGNMYAYLLGLVISIIATIL